MKTLGIFGMSGFAREVGDIAYELGYSTVYIGRTPADLDTWQSSGEGQSSGEAMLESEVGQYPDMEFAIGIGENGTRQKVARHFDHLRFANLLHPSASFGVGQRELIERQRGILICAGVRLTNKIQVGDFTILNLNATVGHDAVIEDFVNVAPGANISGNVHIGTRCWVGTGAAINQGRGGAKLLIGMDTMIGSGSVVVKDCDPNAVYAGVPAKRIR